MPDPPRTPAPIQIAEEILGHLDREVRQRYAPATLTQDRLDRLRNSLSDLALAGCIRRVIYGFRQPDPAPVLDGLPLAAVWQWRIEEGQAGPDSDSRLPMPDRPFWAAWPFVLRVQLTPAWNELQDYERQALLGSPAGPWQDQAPDTLLLLRKLEVESALSFPAAGLVAVREHYHIE